jgi:hypothetical protein
VNDVIIRLVDRLDITHGALLCVIVVLVYLLISRDKQAQDTARLTAEALGRTADALVNLRVELARKATR